MVYMYVVMICCRKFKYYIESITYSK